jgi:hypothetical protein
MSSRELIVNLAAKVLGVPRENVTDETRLNGDQCNAVSVNFVVQTGKGLINDDLQGGTVGDLIASAEKAE